MEPKDSLSNTQEPATVNVCTGEQLKTDGEFSCGAELNRAWRLVSRRWSLFEVCAK